MYFNVSLGVPQEVGFYLFLNPTFSRAEDIRVSGPFPTKDAAIKFHNDQLVKDENGQPTTETEEGRTNMTGHPIRFSFIKGPLREMNALSPTELNGEYSPWGHGVVEAREARTINWFKVY